MNTFILFLLSLLCIFQLIFREENPGITYEFWVPSERMEELEAEEIRRKEEEIKMHYSEKAYIFDPNGFKSKANKIDDKKKSKEESYNNNFDDYKNNIIDENDYYDQRNNIYSQGRNHIRNNIPQKDEVNAVEGKPKTTEIKISVTRSRDKVNAHIDEEVSKEASEENSSKAEVESRGKRKTGRSKRKKHSKISKISGEYKFNSTKSIPGW